MAWGRSLLEWVLNSVEEMQPVRRLVIVGYRHELVMEMLSGSQREKANLPALEFVEQREQLGTGHAVQQLLPTWQDLKVIC